MLSEGAVGREGGHAAHSPVEWGLQACEGRGSQGEGLNLTWVIKQTPNRQRCIAQTMTFFVRTTPLILSGRQEGGACCDRGNMRAWHLAVLNLLPACQPQVMPSSTCIAEGDHLKDRAPVQSDAALCMCTQTQCPQLFQDCRIAHESVINCHTTLQERSDAVCMHFLTEW